MKPAAQMDMARVILAAIDGTISPEEFAGLDEAIRTNPDAADYYAEFMLLYTGLRQPGQGSACFSAGQSTENFDVRLWNELKAYEQTAETVETQRPSEAGREQFDTSIAAPRIERRISRLAVYTSLLSTAALVLLLLYVHLNPRVSQPVVGVLTKTVDIKWHHSSIALREGDDIQAGTLELQCGLAQIRFDSGADVIVEGPAQMEFLSHNSMLLTQGKLLAHVGKEATGFVVRTPGGMVRDIGTEFGVYVKPSGLAEVQVYSGEIHVYPGSADRFIRMFSGDAKSLRSDGALQDIPFQSLTFVRHEEMDARVQSPQNDYYRWKAAVLNLHRDPSLAAHYFYASDEQTPEILVNAAPTASARTNGRFGDTNRNAPQWVTGRWPQKQGVRFERGKAHSIIIDPDRSLSLNGPLTISTWVYYPNPLQKGGHLISCREGYHVNYQFSFFDDKYVYQYQCNEFEFLRFNQKDLGAYSQAFVQEPNRWYHMAVAYDGRSASFYVDGVLFQRVKYEMSASSRDAQIILGAMKIDNRYVLPEGDFDGVVDELMIFSRCLSEPEIQAIYESGLPEAAPVADALEK